MWWLVHIMALLFCFPLLLITVPLHLINETIDKNRNQ